ncbi:hypothetical protein Tco_1326596 [Tanacetum coccineum]
MVGWRWWCDEVMVVRRCGGGAAEVMDEGGGGVEKGGGSGRTLAGKQGNRWWTWWNRGRSGPVDEGVVVAVLVWPTKRRLAGTGDCAGTWEEEEEGICGG